MCASHVSFLRACDERTHRHFTKSTERRDLHDTTRSNGHITPWLQQPGRLQAALSRLLTYDVLFKILYAATFGPLTTWLADYADHVDRCAGHRQHGAHRFRPLANRILTIVVIGRGHDSRLHRKGRFDGHGASRITTQKMTFLRTIWFVTKKIPDLLGLALLQTLITLIVMVPLACWVVSATRFCSHSTTSTTI